MLKGRNGIRIGYIKVKLCESENGSNSVQIPFSTQSGRQISGRNKVEGQFSVVAMTTLC